MSDTPSHRTYEPVPTPLETHVTALEDPYLQRPTFAAAPEAQHAALLEDAMFQVKRVVVGQDRLVERVMLCLLSNGHCLIEGFPGLAKTLTVSTLSQVVGGKFSRIQFTPDLVPADLVGTRIWRPSTESFEVEWGPVFANVVLADEINRAPAKVQSALLEAMGERQVTVGGTTRQLPAPFLVLATQNPIESEGVYALPEAQRDRFLMHVVVPQPTYEEEVAIAQRMSHGTPPVSQVLTLEQLQELQSLVGHRLRPPRGAGLCGASGHGHPRAEALGSRGPGPLHLARRESPWHARSAGGRPCDGRAARSPLRRPAGRLRGGA